MRFLITALLAAIAVASPIVEIIERTDKPNPGEVTIASVDANGSGCPRGTWNYQIGDDGTVVSIQYSKFIAKTGKKSDPSESRRNCFVALRLNVPAGWSYTATKTFFRGAAKIPKTCNGKLSSRFFFSGLKDEAKSTANFVGPFVDDQNEDKDYVRETDVDALIYSRCATKGKEGPLFNINSAASVNCPSTKPNDPSLEAALHVDSQDSKFEMKFVLGWKRC